jgi:hypothetical protein
LIKFDPKKLRKIETKNFQNGDLPKLLDHFLIKFPEHFPLGMLGINEKDFPLVCAELSAPSPSLSPALLRASVGAEMVQLTRLFVQTIAFFKKSLEER